MYYNLFQSVLRHTANTYTQSPVGLPRVHRRHDVAASPYARPVRSGVLSAQAAEDLAAIDAIINPLELRRGSRSHLARPYALADHPSEQDEGIG